MSNEDWKILTTRRKMRRASQKTLISLHSVRAVSVGEDRYPMGITKGSTVNRADLVDKVAAAVGGSKKDATAAVDAVFDSIVAAVAKGDKVAISGFGIFKKNARKARTARNPRTGATVKVAATSVPKFNAGAEFKAIVAGKKKAAAAPKKAAAKKAAPKKAAAKKPAAKKAAPKKAAKKAGKRK